jgi:nitrate/TMAO reductase-like tetraheme cytochrome c subunit
MKQVITGLILGLIFLAVGISGEIRLKSSPSSILRKKNMSFRCSECHRHIDTDQKQRRMMGEHEDLKMRHSDLWCFSCHDGEDRTQLRLINGKTVDFSQMAQLCAQCHGMVYRDWKAGVHGKRIGSWNGDKKVLSCNECHDSHDPKFKAIRPWSPPRNRFSPIPSYTQRSRRAEQGGKHHEQN